MNLLKAAQLLILGAYGTAVHGTPKRRQRKPRFDGQTAAEKKHCIELAETKRKAKATKRLANAQATNNGMKL